MSISILIVGIHRKYFDPKSSYQILNDLENRLEISPNSKNNKNKVVAVGECDLDESSMVTMNDQIFVLEKQADLATRFNLPSVLHCRGIRLYTQLFHCLKSRISDKNLRLHWHCINRNADLHVVDIFLNEFPNSHIGINRSITYGINTGNSTTFKNWPVNQ